MSTVESVKLYRRERREFWILVIVSYALAAAVPAVGHLALSLADAGRSITNVAPALGATMIGAAVAWALAALILWARHAPPLVEWEWLPSPSRFRWQLMGLSQLVIVAWPIWSPSAERLWLLLGHPLEGSVG